MGSRISGGTVAASKPVRPHARTLRNGFGWSGEALIFALSLLTAQGCTKTVATAVEANAAQPQLKRSLTAQSAKPPKTIENPTQVPVMGAKPAETTTAQVEASCESTDDEPGMLRVPGGTFTMGSEVGGEEDEHPAHSVTVDGFWLDINEVTVRDYQQCVTAGTCRIYRDQFGLTGSRIDEARFRQPNQPVTGISWDDARTYCAFRGKRLPREAEWERAARGDDGRTYPWGGTAPDPAVHGCFARALGTANGTTCTVGSYPRGAGPYGHQDLAGNVWEWMADFYDPFAYRRPGATHGEPGACQEITDTQNWLRANKRQGFTGTNPIPTSCERVLRGGAFNYPPNGLRATNRVHHPGDWRLLMAGARCAKDQRRENNENGLTNKRCERNVLTRPQGSIAK